MLNETAVTDMLEAARRSGISERALAQVEEIVRGARTEAALRVDAPERLVRIEAAASQALGEDNAWHWLRRRNHALQGVPLELALESEDGCREVEQVLGRIEHGIPS